jgi:LPS-assembly protein
MFQGFFFIFTLSLSLLWGAEGKIEIKAKYVEAVEGIVTAKDGVLVHYDGILIKAEKAIYDKESKLLTLEGNIETIGYKGIKEHASKMVIHTKTKDVSFNKLFLVNENDVWILSDVVKRTNNKYKLETSVLSSCDISDPLWTMRFSESTFDKDANHIKIYNAKVYFWDMPIFYTPYLSFSTNKERSSGLLFPAFSYNENEGFIYEQPIYWAISDSVDLELNPQIRSNRSLGIYGTLRFVDSKESQGTLRLGYFKDTERYTADNNLMNNTHYGLELKYNSTKVIEDYLPTGFNDALYTDITYLNDIDYLTLQAGNLNYFGADPIQESKINYFASDDSYYLGLNAKYFIDTRVGVENNKTLQILPSIQVHKYLSTFILDNLTYSADFKINHFDRKVGVTMKQAEVYMPLAFSTSFFDDFLKLSFEEELYYSKYFFANGDFLHDDFSYYRNIHTVKLFTDLTKKYDGFTHVLQPSLSYLKLGSTHESEIEYAFLDKTQQALFTLGLPEEGYHFSLSQYFYDESMNLKFYQRLSQKYYVDRIFKIADTSNEMQYNWKYFSLYNHFIYSHEFDDIRESSSYLIVNDKDYRLNLGHSYKQLLTEDDATILINDMTLDFSYAYNEKVNIIGGMTYNIKEEQSKQWRIGGSYARDCWSVVASVRQDIRPTSIGEISENTYYMQLNFKPFGSIGKGAFP